MREIVHVQLGKCGNQIGYKFWQQISSEHGVGPDGCYCGNSDLQLQYINVFFAEGAGCRYVPRAILVRAESSQRYSLYKPENIVAYSGSGSNWAKGHYGEGARVADLVLECVRQEVDACDLLQGIQIVRSLAGGTGSGMGSLLAERLYEEYPTKILKSYTMLPSVTSEGMVATYNAVLSIPNLIGHIHEVFCMDYKALNRIYTDVLKDLPDYDNMNQLIAKCMSGITACLRFPGQLNMDIRKLLVNMVPFEPLHFFVPAYVPLIPKRRIQERTTVAALIRQMFDGRSVLLDCDPKEGRYLTVAAIFRGRISPRHVDTEMSKVQMDNKVRFVDWIPQNIKTAICDIAPADCQMCATMLSNTTAIQEPLNRLLDNFVRMFNKKSHIHYYVQEGLEENKFLMAKNDLNTLINEYKSYQDSTNHDTSRSWYVTGKKKKKNIATKNDTSSILSRQTN